MWRRIVISSSSSSSSSAKTLKSSSCGATRNLHRSFSPLSPSFQRAAIGNEYEELEAFHQSPNENYRVNVAEHVQNPNNYYTGINSTYQQNTGNYNAGNSSTYQQSTDNYNAGSSTTYQQSSGKYNVGSSSTYWQIPNNSFTGSSSACLQKPNNYYMESTGTYQQSPNNYNTGITSTYQQNFRGTYEQNPNNYYTGNSGTYQQSYSGTYQQSQSPNNFYTGNPGTYQQNRSGFHNENVGEYQQTTYGHNGAQGEEYAQSLNNNVHDNTNYGVGQFQGNSDGSPNTSINFQVASDSNHEVEPVQDTESNQSSGTIEEFDAFCQEKKIKEAVEVLGLLMEQGIPVDLPRYLLLMRACGDAKALKEAKSIHEHIIKSLSPINVSTYNKILEMYSKCGSMDDANAVFNKMPQRNLTSWDTMIKWFAKNGLGEEAIDIFHQFRKAGLKPDGEMFIGVFSACGVLGDVNEGLLHFESMSKEYGIVPSMKHYVSVVKMLGSSGYLDEALEFIGKMPLEPSVDVWETMMTLCRIHGNLELGDRCAELVEQMDPSRLIEESKAGLIPLKASDLEKEKDRNKLAGQNLLEVRSRVHEYRAGDTSHPETDRIYAQLRGLKAQMKEAGYIPETKVVLHDIDQESKEDALLAHSERLAVAYGLLSSPARAQIRVIKNLRVCIDCHNALKIISKLVGREFVMRDAKRFHHMKDGICTCKDYW